MKPITLPKTITLEQSESIKRYMQEIKKYNTLSRSEELELIKKAQQGDEKARDLIIKHNLRFVISTAKRYQFGGPSQILLVDLIQLGNLGLIKAVERFDVNSGLKFISYAVWWIRQSIMNEMDDYNAPVKYPHNFYTVAAKIRTVKGKFEQENGYEPSLEQVGDIMVDVDKRVLEYGELYTGRFVHLDKQLEGEDGSCNTMLDMVEDTNSAASDHILEEEDQKLVVLRLLAGLTEREKVIITSYYGLCGVEQDTCENIGQKLGITAVRVRQIVASSAKKMQGIAESINYHPNN